MMNTSMISPVLGTPMVRQAALRNEPLRFGKYAFDLRATAVTIQGERVVMTQKEFDLALLLFTHLGEAVPREALFDRVWGREPGFKSRTLDTHIARVRQRLGLVSKNGYRLSSIYGFGYRLDSLWE
jgi:DNA-binding response OmpR family regulator